MNHHDKGDRSEELDEQEEKFHRVHDDEGESESARARERESARELIRECGIGYK